MKRWLMLGTVLALFSPIFAQEDLRQAEELYRQGKFSAALTSYENCLKNYPKDPFVYYNIGNCYFKMGSKGLAAANYYRAFRLAPRDADIRHNLELTLAAGGERLVPAGVPVVLHKLFFGLSYNELKGLVYILFWLTCLLAWIGLLRRKLSYWTLVACIGLTLCAGWLYARGRLEQENLAVIASPSAEIRSGPGTNFPASASAAQGHLVTIQDEKDAWYQVILPSQGLRGWIEKDTVEKI
ncbi:MAG: tetratricopeptide repeat protein [Elusimicrobiaceae bacterium]|nr:tetratricopeptide repeat protein [Elusimicrobiaceae bacterium]